MLKKKNEGGSYPPKNRKVLIQNIPVVQKVYEEFFRRHQDLFNGIDGKIMTYIESLGGDDRTVKARKDIYHSLIKEIRFGIYGWGENVSYQLAEFIDCSKNNKEISEFNMFADVKEL